jgi:hypothetical protein
MKLESRTAIVAPARGYTTVITGGPLTCGIGGSGGAGGTISAAFGSPIGVGVVVGGAPAQPARPVARRKSRGVRPTDTDGKVSTGTLFGRPGGDITAIDIVYFGSVPRGDTV